MLVVGATGAAALGATLAILAARFAHTGAAARAKVPLHVYADVPIARGWRVHHVEIEAKSADLTHLGQHTHANWVLFDLPFDPASAAIRNLHFEPRALRDTNIAAIPTAIGCVPTPTLGSVEARAWGEYTERGAGDTRVFADHPHAPAFGPRVFAVNVPTRVANAASCWDPGLREASAWRLDVSWEARD